jgi:two-component system chemotaxis response regulator CheY
MREHYWIGQTFVAGSCSLLLRPGLARDEIVIQWSCAFAATVEKSMPNGSKRQILVVDDEPSVRESLGMLLLAAGHDVAEADNGVSALSQLNSTVPDLIVTDLNMPHMSGAELISQVRSRYPEMSIVAMSGDYQGDAVPAGILADCFYSKGQNPHKFLKTIARLIAANSVRGNAYESRTRSAMDS